VPEQCRVSSRPLQGQTAKRHSPGGEIKVSETLKKQVSQIEDVAETGAL
jgi:hypothetical protein